MADRKKAVPENVAGDYFVDSTCIDCDTCRQLAPSVFSDETSHSFVFKQPENADEERRAARALLACPTGSIGNLNRSDFKKEIDDFPLLIEDNVYYLGFNSRKSYGGNSFLIIHPNGNWMIDSPRFVSSLVEKIESLGGLSHIFLTHRDDIADASMYAEKFGAKRIIHRGDASVLPDAEIQIDGNDAQELKPGFLLIPTPGHTRGHMVLLHDNEFLFTGDHLYFDRTLKRLAAFEDYCWYSWEEQKKSLARLMEYQFGWVLAGHGDRIKLSTEETKQQLQQLLAEA